MAHRRTRQSRRLALVGVSLAVVTPSLVLLAGPASAAGVNDIKINEVESNGGIPDDWIELTNTGTATVDISGLRLLDNDNTHTPGVVPAGTALAPGGFYVMDTGTAPGQFNFGLGAADSARLYGATGTPNSTTDPATLLDSYSWTAHATSTYGRCPDGTGPFTQTVTTKGTANNCGPVTPPSSPPPSTGTPWPGGQTVATVDDPATFTSNLSGLTYEGTGTATPGTLWGVVNGPGTLYKLTRSPSGQWLPDPAFASAGKPLHYGDGTGDPDSEGVTYAGTSSAGGIYVSTERNNSNNGVSKLSVLRYDPAAAGTSLNANAEWDLTADIPATGPNLGLEAITWVPDTFLTGKGFFDENKGHVYTPADYPTHGTGIFFVGVEGSGMVYGYALDQAGTSYTRVATINPGLATTANPAVNSIMELTWDRDLGDLWAVCDDTCGGTHTVLRINPATGKFAPAYTYARPTGMPNYNNEGFAIADGAECSSGLKPVFWADDTDDNGNSLRQGTLPCAAADGGLFPSLPEIATPALLILGGMVLVGGVLVRQRRRTPLAA